MTMVFESVQTAGIAQLSYFIGDDSNQPVAVYCGTVTFPVNMSQLQSESGTSDWMRTTLN